MKTHASLEPLEARIAPATLVNPTTLIFTDVDGDLVTVKVNKGTLTNPNLPLIGTDDFVFADVGVGQQLKVIDFSNDDGEFDGVNLTVTAVRGPQGGDGRVNIGHLNSAGNDLGVVVIDGDLGKVNAGDLIGTAAIKSITVGSLGVNGTVTGAPDLNSAIFGLVGKLTVLGDVRGASIDVRNAMVGGAGSIGALKIGGSLVGGDIDDSGNLRVAGNVGSVRIGHDIVGSYMQETGLIEIGGAVGSFTLGGSIAGGTAPITGRVFISGAVGPVKIGGSIVGGDAVQTGEFVAATSVGAVSIRGDLIGTVGESGDFRAGAAIKSFTVGGSIIGGTAGLSVNGRVAAGGDLGPVKIGGDLDGITAGMTGSIFAGGNLKSVTIGGSIRYAGFGLTIHSEGSIGTISVVGDVRGVGVDAFAVITARGSLNPASDAAAVAIKSVKIGGSVSYTAIFAGYDDTFTAVNPDAQIGSVRVGGDWIASSLAAGVKPGVGGFGTPGDAAIGVGSGVVSKIGSVVIRGAVAGTAGGNFPGDSFGIVAQQIGSVRVVGVALPFTSGAGNDNLALTDSRFVLGSLGDFLAHEVA